MLHANLSTSDRKLRKANVLIKADVSWVIVVSAKGAITTTMTLIYTLHAMKDHHHPHRHQVQELTPPQNRLQNHLLRHLLEPLLPRHPRRHKQHGVGQGRAPADVEVVQRR